MQGKILLVDLYVGAVCDAVSDLIDCIESVLELQRRLLLPLKTFQYVIDTKPPK